MHSETADVCKTLKEARESLSACLVESNKTHYVACIPSLSNTIKIYSDLREVLKLMKEHKNQNPRMLSFPSLAEAETFANTHTANEVCQGANIKSNYPQEKAEVELVELKLFSSLTTPQLNEFRMLLEKGNISAALERIMTNPRYLVLSIDMPTILKEGTRYNALHASVIAGQLESCRLVMEIISDVEYLKRLYDTQARAEENSKRLIDLYLNTPDKGANKTPLHFASERGFIDIVSFLVSFKACIRNFNHHINETVNQGDERFDRTLVTGETPEQVACSRYKGPNAAALKAKIVDLIRGGTCYVPLIRSDTTGPYAKVGDPYIPTSPYKLVSEIEDVLKPSSTTNLDVDTKDFRNMKVWAFAGPMSPKEANDFRREWKSPRIFKHNSSAIQENHKVVDGDRGFERFGRELADYHATSWQEYWPFLDAFADLRSEEGLDKLNIYFHKQHVINMMQSLLRREDFIIVQPYRISKEYILIQDLSESEESEVEEEENEVYFSAESPSCSEEDTLDGSDISVTPGQEKKGNVSTVSQSKSSMFSSLWSGIVKLKNILSPGFGKGKLGHGVKANSSVMQFESSDSSYNLDTDKCKHDHSVSSNSVALSVSKDKLSCDKNETNPSSCTTDDSQLKHIHNNTDMDIGQNCDKFIRPASDGQQVHDNKLDEDSRCSSFLSSSKIHVYTNPNTRNLAQNPDTHNSAQNCAINSTDASHAEYIHDVSDQANVFGSEFLLKRKASVDISQTPDKRKYRSKVQSPDSEISSPEKDFDFSGCLSPTTTELDAVSPMSRDGSSQPKNCFLSYPNELTITTGAQLEDSFNTKMDIFSRNLQQFSILSSNSSPSVSTITTPSSPNELTITTGAQLEDSFNTKLDTFSRSLQQFSILSPNSSPSVSTITTPSSPTVSTTTTPTTPSSKVDSEMEPSLHIFTGKYFSQFLSELKSQKFTDVSNVKFEDQNQLPTLFLRQSDDKSLVMADVFLPGLQKSEVLLSQAQGHILDELTHKEAVKNVWVNFLVLFTTPNEAKRIGSLSKDDVVCAVIEGMVEEKDTFSTCSYGKLDQCSLSELFIKSKDSLYEAKHSSMLIVRIVRSSTLPIRDVFVCGTIPTKMDADVYHTLNNKASHLIHKQPSRFSYVCRWYDQMSRQGKDSINNLPSPSRILRSERREPPPVSPLVGTPMRPRTRQPDGVNTNQSNSVVNKNETFVRNLFGVGMSK